MYYRIAGNFGKVFNLANWRFCGKSPNLKPANIISHTITLCRSACDRQIKNSPMHSDDCDSPNLMLTKVSRYTVCCADHARVFIHAEAFLYGYGWLHNLTFQPALRNISSWLHGLSGLMMASPGPMMLKVASMCMGFGSLKEITWTQYLSPRWRFIHSIPK